MTASAHLSLSKISDAEYGHMVIAWAEPGSTMRCRGFVPFLDSIPEEHRSPERCREFLSKHDVDGEVVNDLGFLDRIESGDDTLLTRNWPLNEDQAEVLSADTRPGVQGRYSFNPDDFPGADNCVTWCVRMLNNVLGMLLSSGQRGPRHC